MSVDPERKGSAAERRASVVEEQDETRLAELGYKQELNRSWSALHNFGVSFSIISVVTGITTLFSYGLTTGGPGVMTTGWLVGESIVLLLLCLFAIGFCVLAPLLFLIPRLL